MRSEQQQQLIKTVDTENMRTFLSRIDFKIWLGCEVVIGSVGSDTVFATQLCGH